MLSKEATFLAMKRGNFFGNDIEGKSVIASEAWQSRMEIMHLFLRDCFILFAMTHASYEIATLRSQ